MNYQLHKVTKNRWTFSTDDAIFKILYLAVRNAFEKWTMPIRDWGRRSTSSLLSSGKNGFRSYDIFHLHK
jgi:transposase-like protein